LKAGWISSSAVQKRSFDHCEFRSVEKGYVFAPNTPEGAEKGFTAKELPLYLYGGCRRWLLLYCPTMA
jgi:pectin methylesterase-like acyl-CoA thioesterase